MKEISHWIRDLGVRLPEPFRCGCGLTHRVPIRSLLFGRGVIDEVQRTIEGLGVRVLVVADPTTKRIAGESVIEALSANGARVEESIVSEPTVDESYRLSEALVGRDLAVAVGGGSVIDVCKLASKIADIPYVAVPTTLSHDGVVSPTASLIGTDSVKRSILCNPPVGVLFDSDILENQPRRMISAGCADILAKATSLKDWELGRDAVNERYCELTARVVKTSLDSLVDSLRMGNFDIAVLCRSILLSGVAMALMGSSRPCSGSEHLIAHRLEASKQKNALHGELVGLGTIMMSKYHEVENEGWWEDAKLSHESILSILRGLKVPTSREELGISTESIVNALMTARDLRPDRFTILHKRPLNLRDAESLVRETVG